VKIAQVADAAVLAALPDGRLVEVAGTVWSNVARGGAGWVATSAGLALAGGKYRRAGLDGLAAWAAAESTAAALKKVTSRRRPRFPRGAARTRSSSMPSSHTAAGAAYAVAAGARAPVLAAPLGAAALAVAWSRLATRRHYPSDVVAGAALGVALGAATAALSRQVGGDPTATTD
jgi:undecaprenyl-diphosphatase